MQKIIKIKEERGTITATITGRISTAIEMLDMCNQLDTEQETGGPLDSLHHNLMEAIGDYKANASLRTEFFKGHLDVIFDVIIHLHRMGDYDSKMPQLESEPVLGEILTQVYKHFGWVYYTKPEFDREDHDHSDYKDLLILQRG